VFGENMGYIYTITSEYNLCYVKATGKVRGNEILKASIEIFSDPKWKPGINQIIDYSYIKELVLTREEIDLILKIEEEQEKIVKDDKRKVAIISDNQLYKAIFKYYEIKTKKLLHKTKIFKTIDEALDWIGLDAYQSDLVNGLKYITHL
jgi:hypothetical protein